MNDSVILLREITRDFKLGGQTVHVLKGIDLDIQRGEYVALMGPSGSGKSTLMNLLGCLDTPTSGTYVLADRDVSRMAEQELAEVRNQEIGFVFQTFNLIQRQGDIIRPGGLGLTLQDRISLLAFLNTLTDPSIETDTLFQNPFN